MYESYDSVRLNFSPEGLMFMNICLGVIMFGIALELKPKDFKRTFRKPIITAAGVFSQFLWLPILTLGFVWVTKPNASIALGLFLIAACPGGNVSNFFSTVAKANVALSVTLTAIATLLAIIATPFNFNFWGSLYPPAAELLQTIELNPMKMVRTVLVLLGLPLFLGMLFNHYFPHATSKILKPIRWLSFLLFLGFIVGAFAGNFKFFIQYVGLVFMLVLGHNLVALLGGYLLGTAIRANKPTRRTFAIETGIQNAGLGLILIFNFFDGLGGMAIVAAWWGIWDLISGLTLAVFWSKR